MDITLNTEQFKRILANCEQFRLSTSPPGGACLVWTRFIDKRGEAQMKLNARTASVSRVLLFHFTPMPWADGPWRALKDASCTTPGCVVHYHWGRGLLAKHQPKESRKRARRRSVEQSARRKLASARDIIRRCKLEARMARNRDERAVREEREELARRAKILSDARKKT